MVTFTIQVRSIFLSLSWIDIDFISWCMFYRVSDNWKPQLVGEWLRKPKRLGGEYIKTTLGKGFRCEEEQWNHKPVSPVKYLVKPGHLFLM